MAVCRIDTRWLWAMVAIIMFMIVIKDTLNDRKYGYVSAIFDQWRANRKKIIMEVHNGDKERSS